MFNIRVFAAMFFVLATLAVSAQKSQEQMRAEYLLYIVNQVEFPNEKDFKVFTIGVMGNEEGIFNELKKLSVDAKTPNGKSINIVRFDSLKHVDKVQMLYVNKAQGFDIGQIILKLTGTKTLVVSENYEFQKSMLNFVYVGGLLRFEINKARIDNEGLYVKPLFAAKAVRSKADWEKLFLSTDKELEEEKLVVEEQKKMIEKLFFQISITY
ncbi:MAG: YfiR family protein [Bacteroidota bacterium]